MSRQKLKAAVGLFNRTQLLQPTFLKSDSHGGSIADCVGTKKKTAYILRVTVRHWHAKDTQHWVLCVSPKDLTNMRMNGLIRVNW